MALTTEGRVWVIDKLQDVAPLSNAMMKFMGWGTGTAVEDITNSALATEASEARITAVQSQPTTTTDRIVGEFTAAGTKTIAEVGRFNTLTKADANEIILQRHVFTGVPLLLNDRIEFTLDLTD
jgi:hypothetical protein